MFALLVKFFQDWTTTAFLSLCYRQVELFLNLQPLHI
jgi:hypothetical protein